MADQTTKPKRRRKPKAPTSPESVPKSLATGPTDDLVNMTPPALKAADKVSQRKKLQVMQELDNFRASFTRGYHIILTELAKKHGYYGEQKQEVVEQEQE